MLEGDADQLAGDPAPTDLLRHAGVGDAHLAVDQFVIQVRLVAVDIRDEARRHRVVDDVDVLAIHACS